MTAQQKRDYNRKWRQENSDRWKAIKRRCNQKNKAKYRETSRRWRDQNREYVNLRAQLRRLVNTYGVEPVEYERMFNAQHGCCGLCGRHQSLFKKRLGVDHNHATGQVRKLLCSDCNGGLGMFHENPELLRLAADYIEIFNKE